MAVLLNPEDDSDFTDDEWDLSEKDIYPVRDSEIIDKYTNTQRIAEMLQYLERRVFENFEEIEDLKSKMMDIKDQVNRIEVGLEEISPPKPPTPVEGEISIIPRKSWKALDVKEMPKIEEFAGPINQVFFTCSTETKPCKNFEDCIKMVKKIQKRDMELGLPDIGHKAVKQPHESVGRGGFEVQSNTLLSSGLSFLLGMDGRVYEGRGWKFKPALADSDPKYKETTLDIAFIGDFNSESYPFELFEDAVSLLDKGIQEQFVLESYKIL